MAQNGKTNAVVSHDWVEDDNPKSPVVEQIKFTVIKLYRSQGTHPNISFLIKLFQLYFLCLMRIGRSKTKTTVTS